MTVVFNPLTWARKIRACESETAAQLALEQAVEMALAARADNEYICKCGVRVTPHRCRTGEEF